MRITIGNLTIRDQSVIGFDQARGSLTRGLNWNQQQWPLVTFIINSQTFINYAEVNIPSCGLGDIFIPYVSPNSSLGNGIYQVRLFGQKYKFKLEPVLQCDRSRINMDRFIEDNDLTLIEQLIFVVHEKWISTSSSELS